MGVSGCGKSTVTNLLLRFYNKLGGQILIDDEPIENYDVNCLREQIGFVQQEPLLFNRTIKENVLYGKLDADNAKVRKVCEMANAMTFIESNIEELDKDEKAKKIKNDLISEIKQIGANHPTFNKIKGAIVNKPNEVQDILLQILTKSDEKAMNLFTKYPNILLAQLESNEADLGKGMRWDELVLRVEWNCEVVELLTRIDLKETDRKEIEEAAKTMQYCFNTQTVDRWLAETS